MILNVHPARDSGEGGNGIGLALFRTKSFHQPFQQSISKRLHKNGTRGPGYYGGVDSLMSIETGMPKKIPVDAKLLMLSKFRLKCCFPAALARQSDIISWNLKSCS
jgi:hypothetical protein